MYVFSIAFSHAADADELLPHVQEADLDLLDVGGQQGQGGQGGRADGEALAGGGGGVAQRVEGVGALAHFRVQAGHLGVAAGVVGDGAVGVGGQGDAQGGEHAHRGEADAVEAEVEALGSRLKPPRGRRLTMMARR